uniref:Uncharacterized protein n=1 Tax=Knipowitschia caucasica TaxID=637954 RepID=A0AAV2KG23_KNICA
MEEQSRVLTRLDRSRSASCFFHFGKSSKRLQTHGEKKSPAAESSRCVKISLGVQQPRAPTATRSDGHALRRPRAPTATRSDDHALLQPRASTATRSDDHALLQPRAPTATRSDDHALLQPRASTATRSDDHALRRPRAPTATRSYGREKCLVRPLCSGKAAVKARAEQALMAGDDGECGPLDVTTNLVTHFQQKGDGHATVGSVRREGLMTRSTEPANLARQEHGDATSKYGNAELLSEEEERRRSPRGSGAKMECEMCLKADVAK